MILALSSFHPAIDRIIGFPFIAAFFFLVSDIVFTFWNAGKSIFNGVDFFFDAHCDFEARIDWTLRENYVPEVGCVSRRLSSSGSILVNTVVFNGSCSTIIECLVTILCCFVEAICSCIHSSAILIFSFRESVCHRHQILWRRRCRRCHLGIPTAQLQCGNIPLVVNSLLHPLLSHLKDQTSLFFLLNTFEILWQHILQHMLQLQNLQLALLVPIIHLNNLSFKFCNIVFLFFIYLSQMIRVILWHFGI